MWQPAGRKVCEMGRLGAWRGGTHLLCVSPSFPESPRLGGQGGAFGLRDLGGSQGARPLLGPASRLLCWRETVRQDRRLLGLPPLGQVSSLS